MHICVWVCLYACEFSNTDLGAALESTADPCCLFLGATERGVASELGDVLWYAVAFSLELTGTQAYVQVMDFFAGVSSCARFKAFWGGCSSGFKS